MPRGLNRQGDFRNGSPITLPHEFGTPITEPHDFGNDVTWPTPDPAHFGNPVTWTPDPAHFGNVIAINGQLSTPTFAISGTDSQVVTITKDSNATSTYYTTDGSTPSPSSTLYTAPFSISAAETVKAYSIAAGYTDSAVGSQAFTKQATPTFSPVAGSYTGVQSVTISSASADNIYYTTDGSTPTIASGTLYSGAISVAASETLKALAIKSGVVNSAVGSAAYTIGVSDNFIRANENPISDGGNWSQMLDTSILGPMQVASDAAEPGQVGACGSFWQSGIWSNDQTCSVTLGTLDPSHVSYLGPVVRYTSSGGNGSYYQLEMNPFYPAVFVYKIVAGTPTILINSGVTMTSGDIFTLQVVGNVITVLKNGTSVSSATDSSVTMGNPGMAGSIATSQPLNNMTLTGWSARGL